MSEADTSKKSEASSSEDRWQFDPIKGLKVEGNAGRWKVRLTLLNHLKTVYQELADDKTSKDMLEKIETAEIRIKSGCYDLCTQCHSTIDEDVIRNSAPWITTCSSCESRKK